MCEKMGEAWNPTSPMLFCCKARLTRVMCPSCDARTWRLPLEAFQEQKHKPNCYILFHTALQPSDVLKDKDDLIETYFPHAASCPFCGFLLLSLRHSGLAENYRHISCRERK